MSRLTVLIARISRSRCHRTVSVGTLEKADAQFALAGLIDVERLAANEGDRLGQRVCLHLRRFTRPPSRHHR